MSGKGHFEKKNLNLMTTRKITNGLQKGKRTKRQKIKKATCTVNPDEQLDVPTINVHLKNRFEIKGFEMNSESHFPCAD